MRLTCQTSSRVAGNLPKCSCLRKTNGLGYTPNLDRSWKKKTRKRIHCSFNRSVSTPEKNNILFFYVFPLLFLGGCITSVQFFPEQVMPFYVGLSLRGSHRPQSLVKTGDGEELFPSKLGCQFLKSSANLDICLEKIIMSGNWLRI